jgi:hypothetical protein
MTQRKYQMETTHLEQQRSSEPTRLEKHEEGESLHPLLRLHRELGNQAVTRMLMGKAVQAKLHVSQPADSSEIEADRVAEQVMSSTAFNAPVQVGQHVAGQATIHRACDTEKDKAAVAKAKKRLAVLEPQLAALQDRKLEIEADQLRALDSRKRLDATCEDPSMSMKQQNEAVNLQQLNRKPLDITVTNDTILFRVKFQVFFNDSKMSDKFGDLTTSLQKGLDLVWNHTIPSGVFAGRKFRIVPETTLIKSLPDRTEDAWLIEVRSKDTGPVKHGSCTLPQPGPGDPTSVTEPLCDQGVMSIPPSHVTKPGVLGHEVMHLFGLIDRYVEFIDVPKKGKRVTTLKPTRETGGRRDPLGGEDARILEEDLGYVFSGFGVYEKEKDRSAPQLNLVENEVMRLRQIVETGCAPESLIKTREDFRDKIIKSAEDL